MKQNTALHNLQEMSINGWTEGGLSSFIDRNFVYDEENDVVYIKSEVSHPVIKEIVKLSNSMYDYNEMDDLFNKL